MDLQTEEYSSHISQQFNAELNDIRTHLLEMGGLVEQQLANSIKALVEADTEIAKNVQSVEDIIDTMEMNIDEECMRVLARRQPAAGDLRLIVSVSKMLLDIERIGDEAHKIARLSSELNSNEHKFKHGQGYIEIRHIGSRVQKMLHEALTCFARLDVDMALHVAQEDKYVDLEYGSALRELVTYMMEDPRNISRALNIIWALRALERIGDHSRNIANYVIYLVKGKDVRHDSIEEIEKTLYGKS